MAEHDTAAPTAAPVIFDPPLIYLHKDSRVPPLPVYTQAQADALPPEWMAPDIWMPGGGGGGGDGAQTPWTGDVDAASHSLTNVRNISVDEGLWVAGYSGVGGYYVRALRAITVNTNDITYAGNFNGDINITGKYLVNGVPVIGQVSLASNTPQYPDLATAQAALGANSGVIWRDMNNALFVA